MAKAIIQSLGFQTFVRKKIQDLQRLRNWSDILTFIKSKRPEQFEHFCRADNQLIKEVLVNRFNESRSKGRPETL